MSRSLLVVAGEISGDLHAAGVVREWRRREPDLEVFGIGGDALRAEGAELLYDVRDMAVFGLSEVLKQGFFFLRVLREMTRLVRERKPDAVLLVDYGGFNLRFGSRIRALCPRIFYYVCPQVWASRRWRIRTLARFVDRLFVIFPFEPPVFEGTGLRVDFVGHPLVDEARAVREGPPPPLPFDAAVRHALLPGSRVHEIERLLPVMWEAAARVEAALPGASFLIAAPSERIADVVRGVVRGLEGDGPARWELVVGRTRDVLAGSRAALVASGTATVEAALLGCPMVIAYRVAPLTYALGRLLVRVPYFGMVNLVAGRELCPEFMQADATPAHLAEAFVPLAVDGEARKRVLDGLDEVTASLGGGGAAVRVVDAIEAELG